MKHPSDLLASRRSSVLINFSPQAPLPAAGWFLSSKLELSPIRQFNSLNLIAASPGCGNRPPGLEPSPWLPNRFEEKLNQTAQSLLSAKNKPIPAACVLGRSD